MRYSPSSAEYIAQQFRDCLEGIGLYAPNLVKRIGPSGWKARHKGNCVEFNFSGHNYLVDFSVKDSAVIAILETRVGEEEVRLFSGRINFKKSPAGKISPPSLVRFYEDVVVRNIIGFINK